MVSSANFGYISIDLWEWLALPFYLLIIYIIGNFYQKTKQATSLLYDFYIKGLFIKIGGSIFFAFIYYYYYKGGDTFSYFESALTMKNLMLHSFPAWLQNEFGDTNSQKYSLFTTSTGYPLPYMYYDPQTFTVIRLLNPILLFTFNSFLLSTVMVAWISYSGIWRLYLVFASYYPNIRKFFFIAILCFPSVIFWGSGILKDTITLSCSGWVIYSIYNIFIIRRRVALNSIILAFGLFMILLIKPYIIFALLPGTLMWIFSQRIYAIRNTFIKILIIPLIFSICISGGYYIIKNLSNYMGKFSLSKIKQTAAVTENDLKQAYYGGHSFDIGKISNTPAGYIKIFPKAFIAGIYRPFIWESGNAVMLLSGIESIYILYLTFLVFKRTSIINLIRKLFKEPLLFFALSYSVFFGFAVGLTTSNFGALARFRIAYLPFFVSCLFILSHKTQEQEDEDSEEYYYADGKDKYSANTTYY